MTLFDRLFGGRAASEPTPGSKNPLQDGIALHKQGRLDEARAAYARIPEGDRHYPEALNLVGAIVAQEGRHREAADLIERSLSLDAGNASAHFNLGLVLKTLGEHERAIASFDAAIAIRHDYAEAYSSRGLALHELHRTQQAIESFEQAIQARPDVPEFHYNLGRSLHEAGQHRAALSSYDKALELRPQLAVAYYNRAAVLRDLKRHDDALRDYDSALAVNPEYAAAHAYRGAELLALGRFDEALESCNRALAIDSRLAEAWRVRGAVFLKLGMSEAALADFDAAIALKPQVADFLVARGIALRGVRRFGEAVIAFEQAVSIAPDSAEAHFNLGVGLEAVGELERAVSSMRRAKAIRPEYEYVDGSIVQVRMALCDWTGLESDVADLVTSIRSGRRSATPFTVLAMTDDPDVQLAAARTYSDHHHPEGSFPEPFPHPRRNGPIRVGYFSADFHNHAVAHLTAAVFEAHNRDRIHAMAFAFGPRIEDPMHQRVKKALQPFVEVDEKSDAEIARLARELELDVAVDLGGFTEHSRTGIFAQRAAPIQVSYLGYLGTMGAPYIDYLIADTTLLPERSRVAFTESIAYLPSYHVADAEREVSPSPSRTDFGLPEGAVVFCCLSNPYKISPPTFRGWTRILREVDGSVLLLNAVAPATRLNLLREAASNGIGEERLRFQSPVPRPQYLALLQVVDLYLDTHPYSAGTVANDALWAGLPIVTRPGRSFASRMASSVLETAGLSDLIAHSPAEYEAKAIELGMNARRRDELRRQIAGQRHESLLFDADRFTRNLESAFERMVERREAGLAPDHIFATRGPADR